MAINTHGLTIKGLKNASKNTCNYSLGSGEYDEVFYNRDTGEVWTCYQVSLGANNWTVYNDPAIIKVCNAYRHYTMQQIADMIYDAISAVNY